MSKAFAACLLILALAMAPLRAADPPASRAQALKALEDPSAAVRLGAVARLAEIGQMSDADRLVSALRDESTRVRQLAEAAMWQIWSRSGDAAVDALYQRGVRQMQTSRLEEALATFSDIIRRKPDFAEGWNKRATIYYFLNQFALSMKDCDQVLRRNRNHFGALAGYGQMYAALGDFEHAAPLLERALQVNPNMSGVAQTLRVVRQQLEEKRRKTI